MFSYLRPHRRTPSSNPTSPALPEGLHAWGEPSPLQFSSSDHAPSPRLQNDSPQERMSASSSPPVLPPIANLSFSGPASPPEYNAESTKSRKNEANQQLQTRETLKENTRPQEAPEYSNFKRPYATEQRPYSAGREANSSRFTSFDRLGSAPAGDKKEKKSSKQRSPDSSTAADIQPLQKTNRRPTGTRLPTPPPEKQAQVSKFEPVQPRSGKARLNLLNPMSLLARRRTSQAVAQLAPVSIVSSKGSSSSGSFDPRIRGTVVHDFSAPRARRNLSSSDIRSPDNNTISRHYHRSPSGQYGGLSGTDESVGSPWSGGNHTPVFTENFEEEQYPAAGPHVRKASDISDLPLPKPPYANGFQKRPEQNTAQSPHTTEKQVDTRNASIETPGMDIGPPVPPKNEPELPVENKRISIDPSSTPHKSSPSKKGRSRNVSEVSARELASLGLPKHMKSTKSTSSRFSFDMLGAAEQEKILEDRHREKALRKKNASEEWNGYGDEEDDEYDYDNMDDDDGLEERIPGVNADLEEENFDDLEENVPGVNVENIEDDGARLDDMENIAGFTFQQQVVSSLTSPMSPYSPGMASTPRDANGEVIGFAMTKESPYLHMNSPLYTGHQSNTSPGSSASPDLSRTPSKDHNIHGLGLHGVDVGQEQENEIQKSHSITATTEFPRPVSGIDDDDLYFDDGIIDLPDDGADPVEFDESVFDTIDTDQYGRPLKPFSTLSTLYEPPMLKETPMQSVQEKEEKDSKDEESKDNKPSEETLNNKSSQETMDAIRAAFGAAVSPTSSTFTGGLAPKPSVIGAKTSQGLTQDTLMAYQSALAAAAQAAEASGKFRRESISSEKEESQPSLVRDSGETFSGYEPFSPTYDDFDYDDALEDDPIIAAANAEALANDCDGFYGQEFGFYSAPAASEAQYANGGYFGPRGGEAVNRSQSGRIALREPNLTPITERSEYSNRNSFMSLQLHSPFPADLRSPGLAQLAMMHADRYGNDGDMSLDALMRLRNKAWGGSQASVHSSTGSPRGASPSCEETSSPMGQIPPWSGSAVTSPAPMPNGSHNHRRQNSTFSLVSEEPSPAVSAPVSPSMAKSIPAAPGLASPLVSPSEGNGDIRKTHKRGKSSDSISYLKEDDPVEGQRWVLERRRTAESGELECLREVVEGGRI